MSSYDISDLRFSKKAAQNILMFFKVFGLAILVHVGVRVLFVCQSHT